MESLIFPLTQKEAKDEEIQFRSEINKNATFPTRLREVRRESRKEGKKVTQQMLADDIGAQRSTIGQYESGDSIPDIKTFCEIADYFGVSYDYLVGKSNSKQRENFNIAEQIGLSDNAINALRGMTCAAIAERKYYNNMAMIDIIDDILSSAKYYITLLAVVRDGKNIKNFYDHDFFYYLRAYYALNKFSTDYLLINSRGEVVGARSDQEAATVIQIEVGDVTETALLNKIEERIKCLKEQFWENNIEISQERKKYFDEKKARMAQEIAEIAQRFNSYKEGVAGNGEHKED